MRSYLKISSLCFIFVISAASLVLLGWYQNNPYLKSVVPGWIEMKPNTAIAMILFSIAGLFLRYGQGNAVLKSVARLFAILGGALGLLMLCEYIFGVNFQLDEYFFADPQSLAASLAPGRSAPVNCINFILISVAIFLTPNVKLWVRKTQQSLLLVSLLIASQAFFGYVLGVSYTFGTAFYAQISIPSSVLFMALCTGLLLLHPRQGYMSSILGERMAGRVGRKLLLSAIFIPPIINWLQLLGVRAHWWDRDFGLLFRVFGNTAVFSWIAFQTSAKISQSQREQDAAEFNLRESEARFRFMADGMPQIVWMSDTNGRITYANRQWKDYTGREPNLVTGEGWKEVVHPDDLSPAMARWKISLENGSDIENEYRLRSKTGEYRHHLVKGRPIRDHEGNVQYWLGVVTDIHDQKIQMEDQVFLAKAGKLLSESLDPKLTLEHLVDVSRRHFGGWCQVHLLDSATERLNLVAVSHESPDFAKRALELNQQHPQYLHSPGPAPRVLREGKMEWAPSVSDEMIKASAPDPEWEAAVKKFNVKSYMCIPLRIRGRNQGVVSMVSTTREYTLDDVRLAQELSTRCTFALDNAHLYQESERALQARTDLMSITSHEIKTPLTSLKLQAQVMRRNYEKGQFDAFSVEKLKKFIELNERQVTRLVRLVDEMLDFTRIEQGKFVLNREVFALKGMILEINDRFAEQFEQAGVALETSIEVEGTGNYDRFRLEQAYSNLMVNGLRYGEGKPLQVRLTQSPDGSSYQISVKDQGIGVDPENFERIFGRFERAISASDVSGLGLGLFITHTIVEAHAGKIWVESSGKNQGSTFVMELPKT